MLLQNIQLHLFPHCLFFQISPTKYNLTRLKPGHYSPHSLRRTKSAFNYGNIRNIEVVRELLGPESVTAKLAYLSVIL